MLIFKKILPNAKKKIRITQHTELSKQNLDKDKFW